MKGRNEIILNHETMREVVQFWLDRRFSSEAPRAGDVRAEPNGAHLQFRIYLDESESA